MITSSQASRLTIRDLFSWVSFDDKNDLDIYYRFLNDYVDGQIIPCLMLRILYLNFAIRICMKLCCFWIIPTLIGSF